MMRKALARALVLSGTLGLSATVAADDTDLFLVEGTINITRPNVLFVIDNSANWGATLGASTKKEVEHAALKAALIEDDTFLEEMNVGFMTFASGNSPEGGKVIKAVQPLTVEYRAELDTMLYDADGNELLPGSNNAPYASMLNEAYLYFRGLTPKSGLQDGDHDPDAVSNGVYASPLLTNNIDADNVNLNACAKHVIVLIGNGGPDNGENRYAEGLLTALNGKLSTDPLPLDPDSYEASWGDEFARFMSGIDVAPNLSGTQNVITYVIDVVNPDRENLRTEKAARAYLENIAERGRGTYFKATSAQEIIDAINSIFDELQAINNVYAATTLPVSVNVRGTNLNQVYIGVFRPDAQALPRWFGNLKLYQLGYNSGTETLYLADKNGLPAESASGFIVSNATSFWTTDSTYWYFSQRGTPPSSSDSPDGEVVEKGGAAQKLRDNHDSGRTLYTCTGGCASGDLLSNTPFTTANAAVTQAALGTADATETTALVNWAKGDDNNIDVDNDGSTTDVRPCIHGDVLHSRPAVINYNRNGDDNDVIAFYGANDGVFHAVKGGKTDTDGYELWGFIPEEFFGKLKRLRDNDTAMDAANPKPYFVDGSIGVYQYDGDNNGRLGDADDKLNLYLSMRRGGRFIYALDVNVPASPKFLWKRSNANDGYSELGQTWSEPKVAKINYNGTAKTVLIFGGGYDPAVDDVPPDATPPAHSMGRGIFIVDALTGGVLWQAGPNPTGAAHNVTVSEMVYSIPSDVTVLDRDRDNNKYVDRVYVGDTGGNVWRVDIGDINNDGTSNPAEWAVHKLASIGNTRKFLYPPDVVYGKDARGSYDAVLIGSGDREHPFDQTITNRFYMFKDRMTGLSGAGQATITENDLYNATANLIQVGTDAEKTAAETSLVGSKGWYITLGIGEKVVTSAVTMAGSTFFSTNQPSAVEPGTCANLGIARTYTVSYKDATATMNYDALEGLTTADRSTPVPGGGYPPSPVPVIVEIDGQKREAVVSGTNVLTPPGTKLETRRRVFWFKENID